MTSDTNAGNGRSTAGTLQNACHTFCYLSNSRTIFEVTGPGLTARAVQDLLGPPWTETITSATYQSHGHSGKDPGEGRKALNHHNPPACLGNSSGKDTAECFTCHCPIQGQHVGLVGRQTHIHQNQPKRKWCLLKDKCAEADLS